MKRMVEFEPRSHTLHEKQGNKFVPVAEHVVYDYWCEGHYLLTVTPGSRSATRLVFPRNDAEIEAALVKVADVVAKAMMEKQREPIRPRVVTPRQKRAWDAFCKACRNGGGYVLFPSLYEVIQAGLDELRKELKGGQK